MIKHYDKSSELKLPKRKSPICHEVHSHTRKGRPVMSFERGSGTSKKRPHKVVGGLTLPKKRIKTKVFNEIISQYSGWEKDYMFETLKSGHIGWKHKDGKRRITISYTRSDKPYYYKFQIHDTSKDHLVGTYPDWRYGSKPAIIPEVIMFLEGEI